MVSALSALIEPEFEGTNTIESSLLNSEKSGFEFPFKVKYAPRRFEFSRLQGALTKAAKAGDLPWPGVNLHP